MLFTDKDFEEIEKMLRDSFNKTYFKAKVKQKENNNNKATKEYEGEYILTIKGNEIKIVDNKGNKYVTRCHPDDWFDIGIGVKEVFNKKNEYNKIHIGDKIKVKDNSFAMVTLDGFFEKYHLLKYATKYRYGTYPSNETVGKVVAIVDDNDEKMIVIEVMTGVYVINIGGVEKVK